MRQWGRSQRRGSDKSRTETVTRTVRSEGKEFYLLHAGGREVDVHGEDPDILAVHLLHSAEPPRSASSLAAGRRPYAPLTVSHGARQGVGSAVAGSYACVGLWQAGVPSRGGGGRMGRRCGSICSWKFSAASASSAQLGLGAAAVTSAGSIDGCEIPARHVRDSETQTRQTARGAYCFYQVFRQLQ